MSKTDIIEEIANKTNAMLSALKEYGRCNVCKFYVDGQCIRGMPCDTKKEWEWKGTK